MRGETEADAAHAAGQPGDGGHAVAEVPVQVAHVAGAHHLVGDFTGLQEFLDEHLAQPELACLVTTTVAPGQRKHRAQRTEPAQRVTRDDAQVRRAESRQVVGEPTRQVRSRQRGGLGQVGQRRADAGHHRVHHRLVLALHREQPQSQTQAFELVDFMRDERFRQARKAIHHIGDPAPGLCPFRRPRGGQRLVRGHGCAPAAAAPAAGCVGC